MPITAETVIETDCGPFRVTHHQVGGNVVIVFSVGDLAVGVPVIRIHSSCLFSEAFGSVHCDCGHQIRETMQRIQRNGIGAIVYTYAEGRGAGLENKIRAMEVERTTGCDTYDAYAALGFPPDFRTFDEEVKALNELNVCKDIALVSGSPLKIAALQRGGYVLRDIVLIPPKSISAIAERERKAKVEKMGYHYSF